MGEYERSHYRRDRYHDYRPMRARRFAGGGGGRGGRKRYRQEPEDTPDQAFIREVMKLGSGMEGSSVEKQLEDFLPRLHREIKHDPELVKSTILDCAIELGSKATNYAILVGLLNVEDPEFVQSLVEKANEEFNSALQNAERHQARLLLRFFAALVASNVLLPSSVFELIDLLLETANSAMDSAKDKTGQCWQAWTDYIVYIALMALPWGGAELVESASAEFEGIFGKVEKYVSGRPIQNDQGLKPMLASVKEEDPAFRSDSGGASFLSDVWEAIKELKDKAQWKCQSVIRATDQIDHKLAAGNPIRLPHLAVPQHPPGIDDSHSITDAAVIVNATFPPRGGICLLDKAQTGGDLIQIERIILEEYILDTLHFFREDRVACAQRLAKSIPSPYPIAPLLAEVLFSQMLMLPAPPLSPVAYAAIMVNLCKMTELVGFPRGLSGCVRELFSRVAVLDPSLRTRLAEWLAFHLSNLNFFWPWQKWKRVITAPEHDPQRQFIKCTLSKLVNLSYLANVQKKIEPQEFHDLLPGNPFPKPAIPEIAGDPANEKTKDENGEKDVEMEGEGPEAKTEPENKEVEISAESRAVEEMRQQMASKVDKEALKTWIEENELETGLGGKEGVLKAFVHALLLAGYKNLTHTAKTLQRYLSLLVDLRQDVDSSVLVGATAEVWASSSQKTCIVLQQMMSEGLFTGEDVVRWAFGAPGIASECDGHEMQRTWEIVQCAIDQATTQMKAAQTEMAKAETAVQDAEVAAQNAARVASDAAERVEHGDADNQMMLDRITSANTAESKAREEVANAAASVDEKRSKVKEAQDRRQDVLLQVYKSFAAVLAQRPKLEAGKESSESDVRLFFRNLSLLGSFCSAFWQETAPIIDTLQTEVFAEDRVPVLVRSVLFGRLRLGCEVPEIDEPVFDASLFVKRKGGGEAPEVAAEEEKPKAQGGEDMDVT